MTEADKKVVCKDVDAMAKAANGKGHVRIDSVQGDLEW